jgi:homeobox protein cut-like
MARLKQPLDINFSELQKTLDAQGIEIVDNQKESVVGRKALADKTKGKVYDVEDHTGWYVSSVIYQTSKSCLTKKDSSPGRDSSKVRSQ